MKSWIPQTLLFAWAAAIDSVTCPTNIHSVGPLPYFDPSMTQPCQYAGTLPSNSEETHHMFYWMYPNEDPNAPIILWLNGGPGSSSTFANFMENGPQKIYSTGTGPDDFLVQVTEESWQTLGHIIFID